jgi:hypothetical protein
MKGTCQSCLMPFSQDKGERNSELYCSLCFQNGEFCYKGNNLKEFQKICFETMRKNNVNLVLAWFYSFCIRFAPRWKK